MTGKSTMTDITAPFPVIGFAACSGTGKTTLLTQLLPLLSAHGLRVGMIKHSHHDFEIDKPGKDSYRLREAGAQQLLIASLHRAATGKPLLHPDDSSIIAIASDEPLNTTPPCLNLNQPEAIAGFILEMMTSHRTGT